MQRCQQSWQCNSQSPSTIRVPQDHLPGQAAISTARFGHPMTWPSAGGWPTGTALYNEAFTTITWCSFCLPDTHLGASGAGALTLLLCGDKWHSGRSWARSPLYIIYIPYPLGVTCKLLHINLRDDRWLLGFEWQGSHYVEGMLPFGLLSAPNAVADAVESSLGSEVHTAVEVLTCKGGGCLHLKCQEYVQPPVRIGIRPP